MDELGPEDPRDVAGYVLQARIGEGGMGTVYLSHTRGGQPVALKVVRREFARDPEFRRRFAREAEAARRIHGPYTTPILDSNVDGAQPWIASAFVAGPSLADAVADHGPLPLRTVLSLTAGVAEALQTIHASDVIHRDLKPSNVLLASDGPRVIDFGIARAADATALTGTDVRLGTPAFMAPEQVSGREAGPALDLFALGLLTFFASTGRHPFGEGAGQALLYRIVAQEPELDGCPDELRDLVARMLAKDPDDRPTSDAVIERCRELAGDASLHRSAGWWLPERVAEEVAADERTLRLTGRTGTPDPRSTPPPPPPSAVSSPPTRPTTPVRADAHPPTTVELPADTPAPPSGPTGPTGSTGSTDRRSAPSGTPASGADAASPRPRSPRRSVWRVAAVLAAALVVGAGSAFAVVQLTGDDRERDRADDGGKPQQEEGWTLRRSDVPLIIEAPPFNPDSVPDSDWVGGACEDGKATDVNLEKLTVSTNQDDRLDDDLDDDVTLHYVQCSGAYANNGLKLLDSRGVMSTTEERHPTPSECRATAREANIDNPLSVDRIKSDEVLHEDVGLCVETSNKTIVHLWITGVKKSSGREDLRTYVTTATQWVPSQ